VRGGAENIQRLSHHILLAYGAEVRQSAISADIPVITDHEQFSLRDLRGSKFQQLGTRISDMLDVWLFELVPVYKKHTIFALYSVATYGHRSFDEKQTILTKNHDVVRFWLGVPASCGQRARSGARAGECLHLRRGWCSRAGF
jgi:hypothetical protein